MASPSSAIKSCLGIVGCAAGVGVFGWLRYRWVQHEVVWQPEARFWQYLLPAAGILVLPILAGGRGVASWPRGLLRLARRMWAVGAAGAPLALAQWTLEPQGPWLLYIWMALLAWGAWRAASRFHPGEPSRRATWFCILAATGGMIAMHVAMQLELWRGLSFGYRDIGLFARALFHAARDDGLWVDSLNRSIFGEHAFFALWLLVPLCKLGLDPFHLLVALSAVCLDGPALIVAWYVRRRLASNAAALMAACAWLLLPAHGCLVLAQGYGFHPVYLAVPPLLLGLVLGAEGRWRAAAVCMLLCLTIREDVALTVAAWGVFVFLAPRRRVLGATVFGIAAVYLVLAVWVIVPHYRASPYPHIAFHFGEFFQRGTWTASLSTNISFMLTLMLPLALLPLGRPALACVALPSLAEAMLTANTELHNLCFQYYAPAMVVLFFASMEAWRGVAVRGLAGVRKSWGPVASDGMTSTRGPGCTFPRHRLRAGWCLLGAAAIGQVYLGVGSLSNNPALSSSPARLRAEIDNVRRIRSLLPAGASVTATDRIAAHFLDVDRLWTVRTGHLGDVVVIHDLDYRDGADPRGALVRALRAGGYQPAFADYHLVMLVRDPSPTPLARELRPPRLPEDLAPVAYDMGQGIGLVGMAARPIPAGNGAARGHRVTLVWHCRRVIERDYRFGLTLQASGHQWGPFYFARGAYPTTTWRVGELYRDEVEISLSGDAIIALPTLTPVLLEGRRGP